MAEQTAVATGELGTEAVDLLSELIAHDTVNPPGNEDRVQVPLAEHLRDAGFEVALLEAEPGRPNLVADLPGEPSACSATSTRSPPTRASGASAPGRARWSTGWSAGAAPRT